MIVGVSLARRLAHSLNDVGDLKFLLSTISYVRRDRRAAPHGPEHVAAPGPALGLIKAGAYIIWGLANSAAGARLAPVPSHAGFVHPAAEGPMASCCEWQ